MYTYSFVNEELMNKVGTNTKELIPIKNALSAELTHLKDSLIPNLLLSLEKNKKDYQQAKLFEIEKIFKKTGDEVDEKYGIA
jgi:phenylalanyl-tRNA synthetase beta subunit